jgi:hypothetical protein
MINRWGALLLLSLATASHAQDFQFIEPFGRTVSPALERTPEDEEMLRSRVEGEAPVISFFAAGTYADTDTAVLAAALAGIARNNDQLDLMFGRIDPTGAPSDVDRWRARYQHFWQPSKTTDLALSAFVQDTQDVAMRIEAVLAAERKLPRNWVATVNLGAAQVDPDGGDEESDYVASIALRHEFSRWTLGADYSFENKLGDDVVTLTAVILKRLILSVDDDETVVLTMKHRF